MQMLNLEQTADFLNDATIKQTIDVGHAIIHTGVSGYGMPFVLVNDMHGNTAVTEAL